MRYKFIVPIIAIAGATAASSFAAAQVVPENQPTIETRRETFLKAPYRERTILRPSTSTGESRDTPDDRHNFYLEPGT
jgi:hypothetical protein